MFTKKISCYFHEKENGSKSFKKAVWHIDFPFLILKSIMYNLKQSRPNANHKPILLQLRFCTKRNGSYGKLQYSIMYWGILKKVDYTEFDKKYLYTRSLSSSVPMNYNQVQEESVHHFKMSLDYDIVIQIFDRFVGIHLYSSCMHNDFETPSFA